MKQNKIYIFFVLLAIAIGFSACEKEDELLYSCDKEINTWAIENFDKVQDIKLNEIINYDLEYQKAIFRTISPSKRYQLWYDKFDELLYLSWDNDEFQHIEYFRDNIKIYWFDIPENRTVSTEEEIESFCNSWVDFAKNELSWSKHMIATMVLRLEIPIKNSKLIPFTNDNNYDGTETGGTCKCSTSSDWCDGFSGSDLGDCKSGGCTASSMGCGTGWVSDCDGLCKLKTNPID